MIRRRTLLCVITPKGEAAAAWAAAFSPRAEAWRASTSRNRQLAEALGAELTLIRGAS